MIQSFIIVFLRSYTDEWMLVLHGVVNSQCPLEDRKKLHEYWYSEDIFINLTTCTCFEVFQKAIATDCMVSAELSSSCFRHDNVSFGVFQAVERCLKIHFPVFSRKGKKVSLPSYWNIYLVIFLYQVRIKVHTFLLVLSKTSGQTRKWKNTQGNKEGGALFLERTYCSDIQNSCLYFCCILFCRRFFIKVYNSC